jgi:hypothetical protein
LISVEVGYRGIEEEEEKKMEGIEMVVRRKLRAEREREK